MMCCRDELAKGQIMIDRRGFLKASTQACMATIACVNQRAQADEHALPAPSQNDIPTAVDDIPFVNGALSLPTVPNGTNNRGVINDQSLEGMTHIEIYLNWARLETRRDQWNMQEFDDMLLLAQQHGLKALVFPTIGHTPDWLKQTPDYQPVINMLTGEARDFPSPWAPGTTTGFAHFYAYLAAHYKERIDILKYFIEVGLLSGTGAFWCGDAFAKDDFCKEMLAQHGDLGRLNASWGTRFSAPSEVSFPAPSTPMQNQPARRRWIDFVTWYQDSQVRAMSRHLAVIRKYFPKTHIDVPMGFGSDIQRDGCDRTAICKAAAAFPPISIRSTHGSFNRDLPPRAYWFYKRMAPMCHDLNIGFGTEPPGGDLTYQEIRRQYFEDTSAGATLIFHYYQNFHLRPASAPRAQVIADYKRILRPKQRAIVDIGVLYPTTQMMLDMKGFPDGQLSFCSDGRAHFDYDLVDENMIAWNLLPRYKVLFHTSGKIYRQSTLLGIDRWLRAGGVMFAFGEPAWQVVESGAQTTTSPWLAHPNEHLNNLLKTRALGGARVFGLTNGLIFVVDAKNMPDYLAKIVGILSVVTSEGANAFRLRGFKAQNDATFETVFPDGRMTFNSATHETTFHPSA